ncbi:MAG: TonB family protein [Deltaproteobacteria bacterium]|nr:TonB family protein [Deltaproteobacteria bacterium]
MLHRESHGGPGIVPWLALAVFVHGFIAGTALLVHLLWPPRADERPMEVSLVSENDLQPATREGLGRDTSLQLEPPRTTPEGKTEEEVAAEEAQKKAEEEAKKQEDATRPPGQVVEIPQPSEEKVPTRAKYVSEYNSSVEKQTIHRGRPGEPEGARPQPGEARSRGQPRPPQVAPPPPGPTPKPGALTPRLAMRPLSSGTAPGMKGPGQTPSDDLIAPDGLRPRQPRHPGTPNAGGGGPAVAPGAPGSKRPLTLSDLTPSEEALARAIGRGGSVDAVKDADEGEITALNTRRWKYASFFNRVKRAVADHWHPDRAYRRRDPNGNVYGFKDRLTVLRVNLDSKGKLTDLYVDHPSGIDFLDDEAVRAFKEAQPFPNPPRQLVEKDGSISFKFGFLFELSSTPVFRVFRYRN